MAVTREKRFCSILMRIFILPQTGLVKGNPLSISGRRPRMTFKNMQSSPQGILWGRAAQPFGVLWHP
jgi:hypothetical protein